MYRCEWCQMPPGDKCWGARVPAAEFCDQMRGAAIHVVVELYCRSRMEFDRIGESPLLQPEPRWPYLRVSWQARIDTCPYRGCTSGCERSLCHAGRGDEWGQVTLADCYDCLGGAGTETYHQAV